MDKTTIRLFVLGFVFGALVGFLGFYLLPEYWPRPKEALGRMPIVSDVHVSYAADYRDNRVLLGASHNVFVVKVIRNIGTKDFYDMPFTQFEVEVIRNIKGDWSGTAVISQQGGYKDGVFYALEGGNLLEPGNTYLLATRFSSGSKWHTLNVHPAAIKLISKNENLSRSQLENLSRNDQRVKALEEAYPNEILLNADIRTANTLNSYESVYGKKE